MSQTYDLNDNPALIHEIRSRRSEGESFEQLAEGDAKKAIVQLSPDDTQALKELTEPKK